MTITRVTPSCRACAVLPVACNRHRTESSVTALLRRAADMPDLPGHRMTVTDGTHPNVVRVTCECGDVSDVVRVYVAVCMTEHVKGIRGRVIN